MITYIVTFQPQNEAVRTKIREALKTFPSYCPIHNYCWAVRSPLPAQEIRTKISEAAPGAPIFVFKTSGIAAWIASYGEKHDEWLKKNL